VAAEPETGIITDEELTRAAGAENADPAVAERFLAAEATPATPDDQQAIDTSTSSLEWYGDSAYGTGDLRDAIAGAGTSRCSSPSRCSRRFRAGSPWMTSPLTTRLAR
jgi:hypothetical protein